MLNPYSDRQDYGNLLSPPENFRLDCAVGTSYSLDLDALTGACLSLGLSLETDTEFKDNPVCLLEALRKAGDKVVLFCQNGQIHLPDRITPLYILLEKVAFPVIVKKTLERGYPSFHPKVWLIRFKNDEGQYLYRVIILSRNLTFDRSWDITCSMDGVPATESSSKNQPICDFLKYLRHELSNDENAMRKKLIIDELISVLPNVVFTPSEKEFSDYEFFPSGFSTPEGRSYSILKAPLFSGRFDELLIMSPFLSTSTVKAFNHRCRKRSDGSLSNMLFTRKTSLEKLSSDAVSFFRIFTLKDGIIDGENLISEASEQETIPDLDHDIHAKLYMANRGSNSDLYVGSLNASENAIYNNVEFLLQLKSKRRYLNIEKLAADLMGKDFESPDNPFEEYHFEENTAAEQLDRKNEIQLLISRILRASPKAEVSSADDGSYDLSLSFDETECGDFKVTLKPLLTQNSLLFDTVVKFSGLKLNELSEFFVISVSCDTMTVERVFIVHVTGMPADRDNMVISGIVNNQDCFYRYVSFLLDDNAFLGLLDDSVLEKQQAESHSHNQQTIPALYEKMLMAAASSPDRFKEIDYLMRSISKDGVIPEDFKKLYATFKKVVKISG